MGRKTWKSIFCGMFFGMALLPAAFSALGTEAGAEEAAEETETAVPEEKEESKTTETVISVNGRYETDVTDTFSMEEEKKVDLFRYGKESLGKLTISCETGEASFYLGVPVYHTDDPLNFYYTYSGYDAEGVNAGWYVDSSSAKGAGEISWSKEASHGVIVVQSSEDGENWKTVCSQTDCFPKEDGFVFDVYEMTEAEENVGTFYRIAVAYEMKRTVGQEGMIPFMKQNVYDYDCCLEEYEFFVCSKSDPITLENAVTGETIGEGVSVSQGFQINRNGSDAVISVTKDGELCSENAKDGEIFLEKGTYEITTAEKEGDSRKYCVSVDTGLALQQLEPLVYEGDGKTAYSAAALSEEGEATGLAHYSSLSIGYEADTELKNAVFHHTDAYGVKGESVSLFLELQGDSILQENGWEIDADPYGKEEKEKICGVSTGQVESGAIVIRKSSDGVNWTNAEDAGYAQGLFTTDFQKNYGSDKEVLIYTPDGEDLINGVYLEIVYAFRVYKAETKEYKRYLEKYDMYLCSDNLDAVTFHNLSAEGQLTEILSGEDDGTAEIYRSAETMLSGSGTVRGFKLDDSLNPVSEDKPASCSILKDGTSCGLVTCTSTGRYDISLSNIFGETRNLTLYVDRMTEEEAYDLYFGSAFLEGKRIYSEGEYPVYEGGLTAYYLKAVSDSYLPIHGEIRNMTTGEVTEVEAPEEDIEKTIYTPGEYTAVFTTNPFGEDETASGDWRVFTFHFAIVEEGKAPGPVVNRESLREYVRTNVSDCYPVYYGLTYQSSTKGNITLAFADRESAVEYAYNYEKGTVEQQADGTYRYTGSFLVSQKTGYDSAWDLTDAVNYFAEEAVQTLYFDLSDEFTYLTLNEKVLERTDNLRALALNRSVVIFADEDEKEKLTDLDALPIINSKVFAELTPGVKGEVSTGYNGFEFVRDKNGWDSRSVKISDCNGKEYIIEYDENVGDQLKQMGCPTGIVTVIERTCFGDCNTYEAVYLEDGVNTAEISLTCIRNGETVLEKVTQADNGIILDADTFSIAGLADELDPYDLVLIQKNGKEMEFFAGDSLSQSAWKEPGTYTVKVVNRMGGYFAFSVNVSGELNISFSGEGTEGLTNLTVQAGDSHVKLPVIERYGYRFGGYEDSEGTVFSDEIAEIDAAGSMILNALWEPVEVTITLKDQNDRVLGTDQAEFGTEYTLPSQTEDGELIEGWTKDGAVVAGNSFTIESAESQIYYASVKYAEEKEEMMAGSEETKAEDEGAGSEESKAEDGSAGSEESKAEDEGTGCEESKAEDGGAGSEESKAEDEGTGSEELKAEVGNTGSEEAKAEDGSAEVGNEGKADSGNQVSAVWKYMTIVLIFLTALSIGFTFYNSRRNRKDS